jgi:uncharacterized coiled-coil protein SlyX
MPTQEERLAALEQKVADIELERLYEKRKAAQSTPSEQSYDAKQINHRLTMLLGIASGQENAIKGMDDTLSIIKEQVTDIKQDNAEFYIKFDRLENKQIVEIKQDIKSLHDKFDRLEKLLLDRLPPA